jgi:hypothetical protein
MRDDAARATNERPGIHGKILHRCAVNSDLITLFFLSTARGRTKSEAAQVSVERRWKALLSFAVMQPRSVLPWPDIALAFSSVFP